MDEKRGEKKVFILDEKSHNDEKVEFLEIIKWMKNRGLMMKSSKIQFIHCVPWGAQPLFPNHFLTQISGDTLSSSIPR